MRGLEARESEDMLIKRFLTYGSRKNTGQELRSGFKIYPSTSYRTVKKCLTFLWLLGYHGQIGGLDWMNSISKIFEILGMN